VSAYARQYLPSVPIPPFIPAFGLANRHAQTIAARYLRSALGVALRRERIETPDGDFLDLDWAHVPGTPAAPAAAATLALCIVLHGLEGSAGSLYALETYRQLARRGVAAVGMNFRSCSGEINRTARMYHSGETEDLRFVARLLRERFPERTIVAIGFSLGGNVLVKYLGEEGQGGRVAGAQIVARAAVVSVPYDLTAGAAYTEHGMARMYVRRLLYTLKAKLRQKVALLDGHIDLPGALAARTFREFDDAATAPLHGFADADDYYRRSSSGPFLPAVSIPLRLIHAADDPFLPPTAMPVAAVRANPWLDAAFVDRGGHVGFMAGSLRRPAFWAEARAAEWVAARDR